MFRKLESSSFHSFAPTTETDIAFRLGAIQVLRNADGGGGCLIFWKKRYEGVMFNVISVTRGWVGVQFPKNSVT